MQFAMLGQRGILCPTECWRQINDATAEIGLVPLLDSLSRRQQLVIKANHLERPGSLEHLAASETNSHYPALLKWCTEDHE